MRHALAPHAPYSVSPALFGLIRAALQQDPFARSSVHLGESAAEIEFLRDGTGPWRARLEEMGKWDPSWVCRRSGPVEYLDRMGFLDDRVLVVHGVHFGAAELERLAAKGATLVTCPRGNMLTGAGAPPIEDFFESGVRVAVGTDSLASVPDLKCLPSSRRCDGWRPACRRGCCSRAPRSTARGRSVSTRISGRSNQASAMRSSPSSWTARAERRGVSRVGHRRGADQLASRVMSAGLSEHRPPAPVLVKHARDAFVSEERDRAQWKRLNFSAPPDFSRALAEYDRISRDRRETGAEICVAAGEATA